MKRGFIILIMAVVACCSSFAKTIFPDSQRATNEVELGVQGISRLCPTAMWDHWTFRDIVYDNESNTVVLVMQLPDWDEKRNSKEITEEAAKRQTEWIVENIMEGFNDITTNSRIRGEGDFMLFLSLGTLLKKMEKDGATLRIMLLKPDFTNQVVRDIPLTLTPAELNPLTTQSE